MKPYIVALVVLLSNTVLSGLEAQSMLFVKGKSGAQTAFSLAGIHKLNFSTGNMVVTDTNAGEQYFSVSDIRLLSFKNYFSGINPEEIQNNVLRIYPNPVRTSMQIGYTGEEPDLMAEIIDLRGRIISIDYLESNQTKMDVTRLEPGIYFIRIQNKSKVFVSKFIKN
jgi:hypothetical protein